MRSRLVGLVLALTMALAMIPVAALAQDPPAEVWVSDGFGEETPGWGETRFASIQDSIDAVQPGGTVHVAEGTHAEPGSIDIGSKSLTITGDGAGATITRQAGDGYFLSADGADTVVLQDLTIDASLSSTTYFVGRIADAGSVTLENVTVKGQGKDYTSDGGECYANSPSDTNCVGGLELAGVGTATLTDVNVQEVSRDAILCTDVESMTVERISITDCGHSSSSLTSGWVWAGLGLWGDCALTVRGSNVIANTPLGISAERAAGIPALSGDGTITITNVAIPVTAPKDEHSDAFAHEVAGLPIRLHAPDGPMAGTAVYCHDAVTGVEIALAAPFSFACYDLTHSMLVVGPGMDLQPALDAAAEGDVIFLWAGVSSAEIDPGNGGTLVLEGEPIQLPELPEIPETVIVIGSVVATGESVVLDVPPGATETVVTFSLGELLPYEVPEMPVTFTVAGGIVEVAAEDEEGIPVPEFAVPPAVSFTPVGGLSDDGGEPAVVYYDEDLGWLELPATADEETGSLTATFAGPGVLTVVRVAPPAVEYGAQNVVMLIGETRYAADCKLGSLDVAPFIENGRTFVPVRFIAEAFGAEADWEPKHAVVEVVTLTREDVTITIGIGSKSIEVDRDGVVTTVESDVAAFIRDGRTVLPFRVIAEAFGAKVDYGPKDAAVKWVSFEQ